MKYIGYYDCEKNRTENRNYVLAATNKMTYIAKTLAETGIPVEIISASGTKNHAGCPGKTLTVFPGVTLKLFPSLGSGRRLKRIAARWLLKSRFFLYLMMHIKKGETVIVYHSLGYMGLIRFLRAIKSFRLILELEEIYGDVIGDQRTSEAERRFAARADGYIFPTLLLREHIGAADKPYVIIHGTYAVEPRIGNGVGDGKIQVVYAGTFDPRKGGSVAVTAAAYLPENYHVHILGFGSAADVAAMKEQIAEVASRAKAVITYDGLLSGQEYTRFIQSCQIGLSPQNPDAAFNGTSFPSKILSYMANGLRVVSIRIPAIQHSEVGKYLYYYDTQTPEEIARAIQAVDVNDGYDSRTIINQLHTRFQKEITQLIGVNVEETIE